MENFSLDFALQIVVKRGRISMASDTDRSRTEQGEFSHILINYSGLLFSDLPTDIMVNVLLRLSVKRLFVCKLVCKTWHDLISEPEFARLHFDRAEAYPLIHISGGTKPSRTFHLVPPEEEDFQNNLEICDQNVNNSECNCSIEYELDTEFKLPWGNPYWIFDGDMLTHMKYRKYGVINSCNGLLCLSHPFDNDPLFICNLATGEFVNLPKKGDFNGNGYRCGFGFSPASNQYKVIRMFRHWKEDAETSNCIADGVGAQIHTLGTKKWKDIDFSAKKLCGLGTTYLNGFLYWPEDERPYGVLSFDIENECFSSILVPPMDDEGYNGVSIGVLGGELCISCFPSSGETRVRVMKDNGTTKVWSEVFSIQLNWNPRWDFGSCQPVKYLNDGALLMFDSNMNPLMYKHPRKHGIQCFYWFVREEEKLEVTAHIPSFVSLKDALTGHNVKVLKSKYFVLF